MSLYGQARGRLRTIGSVDTMKRYTEGATAMTTKSLDSHIEITPGIAGGKPRIAGHRIKVQQKLRERQGDGAAS